MPLDDTEEWRPIDGTKGYYSVSSHGRVRRDIGDGQRTYAGRILKPGLAGAGYPFVILAIETRHLQRYVHRLVAAAFLGLPPTPWHEVDHIDGVRTNNHLSNLEWVTPSSNRLRSWALGLQPMIRRPKGIWGQGETHRNARLTEADVRFIRSPEGRVMDAGLVAARLGIRRNYVLAIRRGIGWRHVT